MASFDIATNVAPHLDTGTFMQFQTPAGAPLVNDDKEAVGVVLRARNSQLGLGQLRANGNRRIADAQSGLTNASVERGEGEMTELLVACTVEFRGFNVLDGEPVGSGPAFARKFWSDDRFKRERGRAEDWISSEANFMKP